MSLDPGSPPAAGPMDLETDARRLAARLERNPYFILALVTLLYGIGAVLHARAKPFWFDEIVTLIAASPANAATTWRAAQAVDASPALPHLLTHFAIQWFGAGEIAARLPAIAGYWIFSLCLFAFTRRLGVCYALVALLLPVATDAYTYAFEARAYGLELAFCGLALVSWQRAARGFHRWAACAAIAFSLAGAVMCHYYAVLLYLPLAGGEAFRTWRARRIDWPVWLGFALGATPLVARFATISRVVGEFGHGTWAPVYPEQAMEFWESGLQHTLSFVVLGLAALALWMLRTRPSPAPEGRPASLAAHEFIAAVLFLAIPLAGVGAGLAVTHMFTPRYVLPALAGVAILVAAAAAHFAGGRALPGFLLVWLAVLPLGFVMLEVSPPRNPFAEEPILAAALRQGPVVLSDGELFLQMWYYAPRELRPHILFLADNAAAMKYMGFDAFEGGVRVLAPWADVHVEEYRNFAATGREFLVYQNTLRPGWVIAKVLADGANVQVQSFTNFRQLFRVRLP